MPNNKNITIRVFQSPAKYVQGPTAIQDAPRYLKNLGKRAVLITDDLVQKIGASFSSSCYPELIFVQREKVYSSHFMTSKSTAYNSVGKPRWKKSNASRQSALSTRPISSSHLEVDRRSTLERCAGSSHCTMPALIMRL